MPHSPSDGERFIGEAIVPVEGTADARAMARGSPGLPQRFRWRGREFQVEAVLETHRELGPCRSGGDEQYVRKHWFTIRTTGGHQVQIYFDRQGRRGKNPKARWWLFSISGQGGQP
jgi:hypothetical protein